MPFQIHCYLEYCRFTAKNRLTNQGFKILIECLIR